MTLSSPTNKVAAIALAALWTALSFGAALSPSPAMARGDAAFYRAELAAPATEKATIAGGVIWYCKGTTCIAEKGTSRPVVMCARLAREIGSVVAFTSGGEALPAEELTRCND